MTTTFLSIKQGSRLSLGSPQAKSGHRLFVSSPGFSLSSTPGTLMNIDPAYLDVPFVQEKLKTTKTLIRIYRDNVATLEASEPDHPLLPLFKEQLKRELKTWADVTGDQPCP